MMTIWRQTYLRSFATKRVLSNSHASFSLSSVLLRQPVAVFSGFEVTRRKPFVIGVGGPSGSGKTIITSLLESNLGSLYSKYAPAPVKTLNVVRTSLDVFYKPLTRDELKLHAEGKWNFDAPSALDDDLMQDTLHKLIEGKEPVNISGYDYSTCLRTLEGTTVYLPPFDFVIFEGTLALYFDHLRPLYDWKIYVDVDLDVCLARRILRDQSERGRTVEHILTQWLTTVKPATLDFCIPSKKYADIVLDNGDLHNKDSLSLLAQHIFCQQFGTNLPTLNKNL